MANIDIPGKTVDAGHVTIKSGGPSIGLVLGSGAARGFAHIGVMRALQAHGIKPDIIVGTSMGALVGGCYATDQLDTLEDWARSLTMRRIIGYLDVRIGGSGLIGGGRLANRLQELIGDALIENLPIRFAAISTEIGTGHEVWLTKGSLSLAVRASYALPGIFPPVHLGGRWLVDGALVNPVPVSAARALGARVVIAVNMDADRFGRGTTIASHGADLTDSASRRAGRAWAQRLRATARHVHGRTRAQAADHLGRQPAELLYGNGGIVQHHAGPSHPHAARGRSTGRAYYTPHRPYRLARFSPRGGIHHGRPRGHRKGDRTRSPNPSPI